MKRIFFIATAVMFLSGLLLSHAIAQPGGPLDFGDAPEGALAYPSLGINGAFPTCMNVPIAGWIQHNNFFSINRAWFGPACDPEPEGNGGICPSFSPYDNDECFNDGDAGLMIPPAYTIDPTPAVVPCVAQLEGPLGIICQTALWGANVDIIVTNQMPGGTFGYVNVLMDWDQNGVWGGVSACPLGGAPEHVLVDFPVPNPFSGPLSALMPAGTSFLIGPNPGFVWTRFTITELPVGLGWTGESPQSPTPLFEDGESEDYLLRVDPDQQPTLFPEPTECPIEDTHCPAETTRCPVISTQCPAQPEQTICPLAATECPVVETECQTEQTICPLVPTHCPDQQTLCPKIPPICPTQEFTIWPVMDTMCPVIFTACPNQPTLCPAPPTACPADPTWCPPVPTECPVEPIFTVCPLNPTQCPATPTECPLDYTYCPEIPTVCPIGADLTTCPEVPTQCPEIPTECPQDSPTQCPIDPTFCPELQTECPEAQTQCPVLETTCPTGTTWCPVNPTTCPQILTECPNTTTQCPYVETSCPGGATYCPVNPTYCPILDADNDGVIDCYDNCPAHPNGPSLGTCVKVQAGLNVSYRVGVPKSYVTCNVDSDCTATGGTACQKAQEDSDSDGCGDVCECYANFNYPVDLKVTSPDLGIYKTEYGRIDCKTVPPPCKADVNDDGKVNAVDLGILKIEYGRIDCANCP